MFDSDEVEALACCEASLALILVFLSWWSKGIVQRWWILFVPVVQSLGHVIEDIQSLIFGLNWADASWVKRRAKSVAHSLACYLKNVWRYSFDRGFSPTSLGNLVSWFLTISTNDVLFCVFFLIYKKVFFFKVQLIKLVF